jgi:hypothetical protein
MVPHKENKYVAYFYYFNPIPSAFRVDQVKPPPLTTHTVLTLDFHPDITPENIQKKLPILITFS